jgi:hypothetical protein
LCGSGGSIYNKDTNQNTLSAYTHNDRSSHRLVEIVKATNKSATSIQDLFHNTWLARYPRPQFIVFDNANASKFKREFKQMCELTIMALKPDQLQVTTIDPQASAIIERVHKVVNDILRSFDLKNNHENL